MAVLHGTKSFRLTDKVDSVLLKQRGPTRCDEETIALHEKHRRVVYELSGTQPP